MKAAGTTSVMMTSNRLSYLRRIDHGRNNWIIHSKIFKVSQKFDREYFSRCVDSLQRIYDGLRIRIFFSSAKVYQEIHGIDENNFEVLEDCYSDINDLESVFGSIDGDRVSDISIESRMFKIFVAKPKNSLLNEYFFMIVYHHAAVDMIGRELVSDRFFEIVNGSKIQTLEGRSFKDYACCYESHCGLKSNMMLDYWSKFEWAELDSPRYADAGSGYPDSSTIRVATLLAEEEVPASGSGYRILFAAMARAFCKWRKLDRCAVGLVYHNRAPLAGFRDVYSTPGWMSEIVPVHVDCRTQGPDYLADISEQIDRLTAFGCGYGYLRYLSRAPHVEKWARNIPEIDVSINIKDAAYADRHMADSQFVRLSLDAHLGQISRVIGLSGGIVKVGGGVLISWDASRHMLSGSDLDTLLALSRRELRLLLQHVGLAGR